MRYNITFKFLAVLLCACSLLCAVGSVAGIVGLESNNLYENSVEDLVEDQTAYYYERTALDILVRYHSVTLGGCPEEVVEQYYGGKSADHFFYPGTVLYSIMDENGQMLYSTGGAAHPDGTVFKTDGTGNYDYICLIGEPQKNDDLDHLDATEPVVRPTVPDATAPTEHYDIYSFYDRGLGAYVDYPLAHVKAPADTITLYIQPNALLNGVVFELLILVWNLRYDLFWILAVSLLLFAVGAVYLCCAAGKKPGREELKPGGFNCLPLDLYVLILATGAGFSFLFLEQSTRLSNNIPLLMMYVGSIIFADCLLLVAFCFACAAQFKMPKLYWMRHTICGICVISAWEILKWLFSGLGKILGWLGIKVPPATKKLGHGILSGTKRCWTWLVLWSGKGICLLKQLLLTLGKGIVEFFKWLGRSLHRFLSLMPLTWQWLLTGFAMTMVLYICLRSYKTGWI